MSKHRIYNEILCPEFWNSQNQLNPEIRKNLLQASLDFYKNKSYCTVVDIYLMGSIANYNWNDYSDADVHIIIDFKQLAMPVETVKNGSGI